MRRQQLKMDPRASQILEDPTKFYRIVKSIGKGAYGLVYLGIKKDTGSEVAIKRLKITNGAALQDTERELAVLRNLDEHAHVMRYYGKI